MSSDKEAISILQPNEHLEKKKRHKIHKSMQKGKVATTKENLLEKKYEINISP